MELHYGFYFLSSENGESGALVARRFGCVIGKLTPFFGYLVPVESVVGVCFLTLALLLFRCFFYTSLDSRAGFTFRSRWYGLVAERQVPKITENNNWKLRLRKTLNILRSSSSQKASHWVIIEGVSFARRWRTPFWYDFTTDLYVCIRVGLRSQASGNGGKERRQDLVWYELRHNQHR